MMKRLLAMAFAGGLALSMLAGCGQDQGADPTDSASTPQAPAESSSASQASAGEASGESASGIKGDPAEAERQILAAMQYQLEAAYGDKVDDARVSVGKIYTAEEEQSDELLKSYDLGPDEVAFEVRCELHPAGDVDVNELMAATGEYDEDSGWVVEKHNVGILRPNADGEPAYVITDFGTGF